MTERLSPWKFNGPWLQCFRHITNCDVDLSRRWDWKEGTMACPSCGHYDLIHTSEHDLRHKNRYWCPACEKVMLPHGGVCPDCQLGMGIWNRNSKAMVQAYGKDWSFLFATHQYNDQWLAAHPYINHEPGQVECCTCGEIYDQEFIEEFTDAYYNDDESYLESLGV